MSGASGSGSHRDSPVGERVSWLILQFSTGLKFCSPIGSLTLEPGPIP